MQVLGERTRVSRAGMPLKSQAYLLHVAGNDLQLSAVRLHKRQRILPPLCPFGLGFLRILRFCFPALHKHCCALPPDHCSEELLRPGRASQGHRFHVLFTDHARTPIPHAPLSLPEEPAAGLRQRLWLLTRCRCGHTSLRAPAQNSSSSPLLLRSSESNAISRGACSGVWSRDNTSMQRCQCL